jgi:hypothetical protein
MTNCNVAGPSHPLDLRYFDSPTRHQHPSDFDRMRNDSPFSHTHENRPRNAATDCYWSLFALKPHFPSSVLPDVLSAHPEHRRPATASSTTFPHDCTTTAVRCSYVSPTFFYPYLWLIGPFRMTWLNLLRTLFFLLFYLRISPTSLPTSPTPNDTLRYETRRF